MTEPKTGGSNQDGSKEQENGCGDDGRWPRRLLRGEFRVKLLWQKCQIVKANPSIWFGTVTQYHWEIISLHYTGGYKVQQPELALHKQTKIFRKALACLRIQGESICWTETKAEVDPPEYWTAIMEQEEEHSPCLYGRIWKAKAGTTAGTTPKRNREEWKESHRHRVKATGKLEKREGCL
ncbi:hypothetical protein BT96DRAFT_950753 [Gymnopus androsaceus JB14]|uniref:Uncharacterized protein n=1 Tax=Gymnopus androsaceus JB14 TaxID=1447944 RepID=A0A6A4GFE7_9AGAR|nr:hypothetical protein BT96DRAFT_950753 [Gymnopus androsaceus JB14]